MSIFGNFSSTSLSLSDAENILATGHDIHLTTIKAGYPVAVLKDVSLKIPTAQIVSVLSNSATTKLALLQLFAGLNTPTQGYIAVDGQRIDHLSANKLAQYRKQEVGWVAESQNLLPALSIEKNLHLPLWINNSAVESDFYQEIVDLCELSPYLKWLPEDASPLVCQKTAIARAVLNRVKLLVCDEPTANMDTKDAKEILGLLDIIAKEQKISVLLGTTNPVTASFSSYMYLLRDGIIAGEINAPNLEAVLVATQTFELDFS